MKKIRTIIADDHSVVRIGLVALLETESDMTVVGEAQNGEETVRLAEKLHPDVVLLDLMMPVMDGVATTKALQSAAPDTHVLILTSFADPESLSLALQSGAAGAVLKSSPETDIVSAIRQVAEGRRFLSPELEHILSEASSAPQLTARQREILSSVIRGRTNRQIGMEIGIREDSVGQHLSTIFTKLGASNRAEAIAIALKKHLLKI